MSDWQPIETAPKDGMPIDVWCVCGRSGFRLIEVLLDADGTWRGPLGSWTRVSHWMRPDPPKDGAR